MKILRNLLIIGVTLGVLFSTAAPALAETYGGGTVSGYAADTALDNGTIVQLTGENSNRVKIATEADRQNMFGVTVDRNTLPLALSNTQLDNETFIAVSGTYNTLVSTQGGPIAAGDYVTLSSINGVAMKASVDEKTVFGRANTSFDGNSVTLGSASLKDVNGSSADNVKLGTVAVTIDIRDNPMIVSTEVNVPDPLRRVGLAIAEKEVSPVRIYLSLGITIVCIIAAIAILYAGVRHGVVAIGRNPMTKKSIFRALLEVILTSALILIIGLFAVYLLLRL